MNLHILHGKACDILNVADTLAVDCRIAEEHILHRQLWLACETYQFAATVNLHVVHGDVVEIGGIFRLRRHGETLGQFSHPFRFAQQVAIEGRIFDISPYSFHKNIRDTATTCATALEAEGLVGAVEYAVMTIDIVYTASHLGTADDTAGTSQS